MNKPDPLRKAPEGPEGLADEPRDAHGSNGQTDFSPAAQKSRIHVEGDDALPQGDKRRHPAG